MAAGVHTDEQKMRARIAQLQEWRTHGITTLAAGDVFEAERKRRVRVGMHTDTDTPSMHRGRSLMARVRRRIV
jgi:hypothetical protein